MALAHAVEDVTEAAYRGDLFEKRRLLMEELAKHCDWRRKQITPS